MKKLSLTFCILPTFLLHNCLLCRTINVIRRIRVSFIVSCFFRYFVHFFFSSFLRRNTSQPFVYIRYKTRRHLPAMASSRNVIRANNSYSSQHSARIIQPIENRLKRKKKIRSICRIEYGSGITAGTLGIAAVFIIRLVALKNSSRMTKALNDRRKHRITRVYTYTRVYSTKVRYFSKKKKKNVAR